MIIEGRRVKMRFVNNSLHIKLAVPLGAQIDHIAPITEEQLFEYPEMQDDMENSDMLMKKIISIYEEHTQIPKKEISNLLKRDIWWEAETCLKYGLVDELV